MQTIQQLAEATKARYRPVDRKPEPDWVRRELSASKIVKETAQAYAELLIKKNSEPFDAKWGFLGNTIADKALVDWDAHEIELRVPIIGTDWSISGHPDGISLTNQGVVVAEHKYFLVQQEGKIENAGRQGTLYLGMAHQMALRGQQVYESAPYHHTREVFHWPEDAAPAGIVVACSSSHREAERVDYLPITAEDAAACVRFYVAKAQAILASFEAGTLDAARAWDESPQGISEKGVRSPDLYKPIPALESLGAEAVELQDLQADLARMLAREKQLKATIQASMKAAGATIYQWGGVAYKIVTVKDSPQPAKEAWVKKGYTYIQEA